MIPPVRCAACQEAIDYAYSNERTWHRCGGFSFAMPKLCEVCQPLEDAFNAWLDAEPELLPLALPDICREPGGCSYREPTKEDHENVA